MKQRIRHLAAAAAFLFLAFELFLHCTYLFRNTGYFARQNILGFYDEKDDSLDVVFVGPSSVYRYWSPMSAWNLYGFTSYDYSVSAMSRATVLTAIKDILRSQSPDVIVVDVRKLFWDVDLVTNLDSEERNILDSIDYGPVKLQGVKYLSDHSTISEREIGSAYMELAQYHNNKEALAEELNWQLIDNRLNDSHDAGLFYKGFAISKEHTYQSKENSQLSNESAESVPEYYMDILEYGKKNDLPLLFTASPLTVSEQQSKVINKMQAIAEEYGYGFIDGNRFYDEMNLNFTTDFYNGRHTNILGAEKWTEFLGDYLVKEFALPDHRKDPAYDAWNTLYEQYKTVAEAAADETLNLIRDHDASLRNEEIMRGTEDFAMWFHLANDENISILVSVDSCSKYAVSNGNAELLRWLGIDEVCIGNEKQYYALYCNRIIDKSTFEPWLEGKIGEKLPFTIRKETMTELVIEEKKLQIPQGKISFVAVDHNLMQMVDFVELQIGETGDAKLKHMAYK